MPADTSALPKISLKRTETSTSPQGAPGATITFSPLPCSSWTNAGPPGQSPGTSSIVHLPETIVHPSRGLLKSKLRTDACDLAMGDPIDIDAPAAAAAVTRRRRRVRGVAVGPK